MSPSQRKPPVSEDISLTVEEVPQDELGKLRSRGLMVVGIVVAFLIAVVYGADASLPDNALGLPWQNKGLIRSVVPEGWGFFTRSPREAELLPWHRDDTNQWSPVSVGVNASPGGGFGASRRPRALSIEMGLIYGTAANQHATWRACDPDGSTDPVDVTVNQCLATSSTTQKVHNNTPKPTLCGPVAIVSQEPLPWAWASDNVGDQMPVKVMQLEVSC